MIEIFVQKLSIDMHQLKPNRTPEVLSDADPKRTSLEGFAMSEKAGTGKTVILERGSFGRFKVAIV